MGRHSRKGPAPAPPADPGRREAAEPGTGRRRRAQDGQDTYSQERYSGGSYSPDPYPSDPYSPGARGQRTGYAQGTYGQGPRAYGQGPGPGAYGRQQGGGRPVWDTPMHGTPVYTAPGETAVRGGHPEHTETMPRPPERYGDLPGTRSNAPDETAARPFIPAPRRERDPEDAPEELPEETPARKAGKGRTFTGIAAAAVTTVLAVVVAGQVTDREADGAVAHSAEKPTDRAVDKGGASRSDDRLTPTKPLPAQPVKPPTYEQLMATRFAIDPKLKGSGEFEAVAGFDRAPGKGRKVRYRVDVEKGIGLDPKLFAEAVQKTLNDERSWAGKGAMTFERISSGDPEFVITLASPGTTGVWCAKSDLDTTVDNVSCDSASTSRVMINAFRWAQGSDTFGAKAMFAYRQMLINHEVGHRLGHGHVSCRTPGALAPVMQQQTKSLDVDGIKCRPNPWVHPGS
ncbi:DUF3152 domain-containing protein [Streptomyces sp. Je 1-79]|uniref:DUF3152 domain-containing protein n=1 Tax=Streptomyces sp. Je 1-79 TaxID=2943847 RepID=UPI0021A47857|nr:DUF3152 domain-containing protein [Streptomyces sp. Je 1-79]MCT4355418.1 DUF3152 domain-containing protein [Streptomyces sp. Je 1-79]